MKMKKKGLRFVAGVLAVTMLISSNSVFATTTAEYDEQIESIKSQQAENEAEAERLNEKLDSLRDQTSEAEAYQATLEEQITTYQTSIDLAVQNITQLNTNITNLETEIKKADEEYADTFAELKVRLRSLYASGGNLTTLQILFDSTSLYDFSMRSEAMKTITKHDRELMEKIRLYRIQTQDQRDELNKEKEELADQKKDLEKKQEELQALEEENQKLIDELNVQSSEAESDLAAAEAAKEDYVSQLDQLIADRNAQAEKEEEARRQAEANQNAANNNSGSGNTSSGSGNTSDVLNTGDLSFSWPLAGYGYGSITQYFGGMFSGSPHGGVDIGVPYGTPIYAAESGQVISAEYHWSWGNNVLIWHNGTYSTRYAHCSSLAVSAGEYVQKGQIVGYVGSTGQSTGNHLHFEVYQNGTRVDPLNFV